MTRSFCLGYLMKTCLQILSVPHHECMWAVIAHAQNWNLDIPQLEV